MPVDVFIIVKKGRTASLGKLLVIEQLSKTPTIIGKLR